MDAGANQQIGDYEILGVLGSGGMGKVYRVRNVISDRVEAMKVLLPDLAGRQELATRFLREIKLLASLNHPNIATLCTALTIDNQLVMIMEYVEGVTLDELIGQGRVSVEDGTSYIAQALAALSYAHQKGVIHRDIKPANMMLTANHLVKLMDFGIARSAAERSMTQTGTTLGSVNYMSPEQITGQAVDARSDVYSTGISLYEIVTGQRPFNAPSDYELMAMHVKESPKAPMELRPWLPSSLNEIILTAIAKDPNDRFQSADAFRNALLKAQDPTATGPLPSAAEALPSARLATVVEGSRPMLISSPALVARERTQVATRGSSGAHAGQPAALANRPPAASGRRNVYIAAGAVLALAAIGAPAIYLTNHHASSGASSTPPSADHSNAVTPPPANPVPVQPVVNAAAKLPPTVAAKAKVAVAVAAPAPAPPRSQYQPPQSLRGDVVAQQSGMNLNLSKAQKALEAHDADRADRFAGLAEADIAQLKKFLGR
jgi:serine/threonine protein kinase